MILVRTPFRISLLGGGTDYPEYFRDHKGKTLAFAIDKYGYISINFPHIKIGERFHLRYSQSESVETIKEIDHPSVREILKHYDSLHELPQALYMSYTSDLPSMSGMGSSSSFTVGLINGIHYLLEKDRLPKYNLAELAIDIERNRIKESVGWQDQITAAYGGLNAIELEGSVFRVNDLHTQHEAKKLVEEDVFLVYTGLHRKASDLAIKQIDRIPSTEMELQDMYALADHMEHVMMEKDTDDIEKEMGRCLDESWKIKKSLTDSITNTEIDALYRYGKKHGATGGKLLGAGGGGFFLFWVPRDVQWIFCDALEEDKVGYVQVSIDYDGSRILQAENGGQL